jgi:polyisoprenoid-binding protein YceI
MPTAIALRFALDAKVSQFTVHAFASGLASVVAHNPKFAIRDFAGETHLDPETLWASLKVAVRLRSLELTDEVSEYDRGEINRIMFDEVLEVSRFPEAVYDCPRAAVTKISENMYRAELKGNLSLHGNTRQLNLTSQIVRGEDSLRAYGEFTVNQSDFGIRLPSVANGTIKMKDQVKIAFFIISRKV